MKAIDVVQGQDVDKGFHFFEREEVSSHVEHRATITKAGLVVDGYAGKKQFLRSCLRFRLAQCLYAIERSGSRSSVDANAVFAYIKAIGLLIVVFQCGRQHNEVAPLCVSGKCGAHFGCFKEVLRQQFGIFLQGCVTLGVGNTRLGVECKSPCRCVANFLWKGHHTVVGSCFGRLCLCKGCKKQS